MSVVNIKLKKMSSGNGTEWIKIVFAFGVMGLFSLLPPIVPITSMGMKVVGVFLGIVLLISLVDTIWPSILVIGFFPLTGVMTLNEAIMGSFGSWVTMFVVMSFILTYALNETGFIARLTSWFLSRKFVNRSPWHFTYALLVLAMVIGWFLDPVPVTAFFLMFAGKLFKELGYKPGERYPAILTMALVFTVNIAGGMTPISHPLAIIGIGVYNQSTSVPISMMEYLLFGMSIGLVIFAVLCLLIYFFAKPDFSRFADFDINTILIEIKPMEIREKITVSVFFVTAALWLLPGILGILVPGTAVEAYLNKVGVTFIAILAVLKVEGRPVLDLKEALKNGFSWGVVFLVGAAILLGGAVTKEGVGVTDFIVSNIVPMVENMNVFLMVLVITLITSLMTNFSSNVTTVIVMTSAAIMIAQSVPALNGRAIALTTTFTAALAYCIPASFASIAVLYGDEYSKGSIIFKFGLASLLITSAAAAGYFFVGGI